MRGGYDFLLSKGRGRNRIFPLSGSRMSKIALGVYDTLGGGQGSTTADTLEQSKSREVAGFKGERHRPSYRFRDAFGCRTITYVQLSR